MKESTWFCSRFFCFYSLGGFVLHTPPMDDVSLAPQGASWFSLEVRVKWWLLFPGCFWSSWRSPIHTLTDTVQGGSAMTSWANISGSITAFVLGLKWQLSSTEQIAVWSFEQGGSCLRQLSFQPSEHSWAQTSNNSFFLLIEGTMDF